MEKSNTASPITLTLTLTPDNQAGFARVALYTGLQLDAATVNLALDRFLDDVLEDRVWEVQRDRKKRTAAFKRAGLSASEIAKRNAEDEAEIAAWRQQEADADARSASEMAEYMTSPEYLAELDKQDRLIAQSIRENAAARARIEQRQGVPLQA